MRIIKCIFNSHVILISTTIHIAFSLHEHTGWILGIWGSGDLASSGVLLTDTKYLLFKIVLNVRPFK